MPGSNKEEKMVRRRSSSRKKSIAQKKHLAKAKAAMELWKSGKASSLKLAWKKINSQ